MTTSLVQTAQGPILYRLDKERLVGVLLGTHLEVSGELVVTAQIISTLSHLFTHTATHGVCPGGMIFHRSGLRNSYVLAMAARVAFKKLPWVAVEPLDWV
jgi:hypothetical protein